MANFTADPRDGNSRLGEYDACCCETLVIAPGEKAPVRVLYANWIGQIRARGLVARTEIDVQQIPAAGFGPASGDITFAVDAPGTLDGSVALPADPVGSSYALAESPLLGAVVLQSNGAFAYTVGAGLAGPDYFTVEVTGGGKTFTRSILVNVTVAADFAFIVSPENQFMGAINAPSDPANSCYQIASGAAGAAIYLEPAWNGPLTLATPSLLAAAAPVGAPGSATIVQTKLGVVQLTNRGAFLYTPNQGVSGLDVFVVNVVNAAGAVTAVKTVTLQLPDVWVDMRAVRVHSPFLSFPVAAQKDARIGDRFRITVLQDAQDCSGCNYTHKSCYDVVVQQC